MFTTDIHVHVQHIFTCAYTYKHTNAYVNTHIQCHIMKRNILHEYYC